MYGELTCSEVVELLTDYLEGVLPRPRHEEVEHHLLGCDGCTVYLEQFRETIALNGRLGEEDVPPPIMDDLLKAFRNLQSG